MTAPGGEIRLRCEAIPTARSAAGGIRAVKLPAGDTAVTVELNRL